MLELRSNRPAPRSGAPDEYVAPSAELLETLRSWVKGHFGIVYSDEQSLIFGSRIETICRQLAMSPETLLSQVQAGNRGVVVRLAEAVSTNHTYFMRESEALDFFRREIVPSIQGSEARIWSAAASSGDEAYTIALLFRELVPESRMKLTILGTDLSERQLKAAEEGIYPAHQLNLVDPERLNRWFSPMGLGQYQVKQELRSLCTFRRLNLTQLPWPFEKRFSAIFLRNVLFYFDQKTRKRIVDSTYDVAEPGAWLVTSLTEPMLDIQTRWVQVRPAIYRKYA